MRKQIRQFSKYATRLIACTLLICIVSAAEIHAQKKPKTTTTPKIYWYMDYTVTIKGSGIKTANPKNYLDSSTVWSIDRTYSGMVKLTSSYPMPTMEVRDMDKKEIRSQETFQVIRSGRFTKYMPPSSVTAPTRVNINDVEHVIVTSKDAYQCRGRIETTTKLKGWVADGTFDEGLNVWLATDSKSLTYNVFIQPVFVNSSSTMRSQTIIDRSNSCNSKEPAHEETPVDEKPARMYLSAFPAVKGLISGGAIQHTPNKPYPPTFSTAWEYDSGDMTPDEPLIDDVPDSKTNVKVRVRYRFSKTPIY